jgi:hypothetical protein
MRAMTTRSLRSGTRKQRRSVAEPLEPRRLLAATFRPLEFLELEQTPSSVAVADFDENGFPDVVAVHNTGVFPANPSRVDVFFNDGVGAFDEPPVVIDPGVGAMASFVNVGDFNDDGNLDVVATFGGSNNLGFGNQAAVLLGDGAGLFADPIRFIVEPSTGGIGVADFDEDGKQDLAIPGNDHEVIGLHFGNGDGTFDTGAPLPFGNFSSGFVVATDVDGDHHADVVLASTNGNYVKVFYGIGDGTFSDPVVVDVPDARGVAVGDFNKDGIADLAVTSGATHAVHLAAGRGARTFGDAAAYSVGDGKLAAAIDAADFDRDGNLDVAVGYSGLTGLVILHGDGAGAFSAPSVVNCGQSDNAVRAADLNKDGKIDLVATSYNPFGVSVLINGPQSDDGHYADPFEADSLNPYWAVNARSGGVSHTTDVAHGGNQSLAFTSTRTVSDKNITLVHFFSRPVYGHFSAWVYDTSADRSSGNYMQMVVATAHDEFSQLIGYDYDLGPTNGGHYVAKTFDGADVNTGVDRTQDWHHFEIDVLPDANTLRVDGQQVLTGAGGTAIDRVQLSMFGPAGRPAMTGYFDDFEFTPYVPPAPPAVTGVFVSGSAWSPAFRQAIADRGLGSADYGFKLEDSGAQPNAIPWTNLDRVTVRFSQDVRVLPSDLAVHGVSVPNVALDPAGFSYDAAAHTATWRLPAGQSLRADKLRVDLDGDAVRNPAGALLDGGDFHFRFNALPGDVDRSGAVVAADFSAVKAKFFSSPGSGAAYSVFHDVDGSGTIVANDFSEVKRRFFQTLPAGDPAGPSAGPSAAAPPFARLTAPAHDLITREEERAP